MLAPNAEINQLGILQDFRTEANRLINKSLSENTRAAYKNGLACFDMFRTEFSLAKLWPPSLSHVTQFIAYLSFNKKSHHTVSLYLSALNFECKLSQHNKKDVRRFEKIQ